MMKSFFLILWGMIKLFSLRKFLSSLLQAFGLLWLIIEPGTFFFPSYIDQIRSFWWIFLILGSSIGLWRAWPRVSIQSRVANTDATIEVRVCNLFKRPGSFVIGSNTTFDTSIEDGTISEKSIQGQYQQQFCDSIKVLDDQLISSLNDVAGEEIEESEKAYGKKMSYPIGTVASARCSSRRAYYVAIATLNSHRNASASTDDILDALPNIWETIRRKGDMEPVVVPVLGSGFSRVQATREELIREIIKSFIIASYTGRFCERLTIAISPHDFIRAGIDFTAIGEFLEHETRYAPSIGAKQSSDIGKPAHEGGSQEPIE